MLKRGALLAIALAFAATVAGATTEDRWLHIKVEDTGASHELVRVNLPLSMIEKILAAVDLEEIDGDTFRDGRIVIDDTDLDAIDLQAILEALRTTEDMEFVSVDSADEHVRVAKDNDELIVRVSSGKGEGGEKVSVRLPLVVVDALLTGERNELDFIAALHALADHGRGDLVVVDDGSEKVRIWIDSKNTTE